MRIWSLHPKYLDTQGLVALWRETLLAKKVLEGKTKGYTNHPQLNRFRASNKPLDAINFYLQSVWIEAETRTFRFDKSKFVEINSFEQINASKGQLDFEIHHLLNKLKVRDAVKYNLISELAIYETHPLFNLIDGDIEPWEKLSTDNPKSKPANNK